MMTGVVNEATNCMTKELFLIPGRSIRFYSNQKSAHWLWVSPNLSV